MHRRVRAVQIAEVFAAIRQEADIPLEFPAEAVSEATEAQPADVEREDLRSIPFVTIDPPDAFDLDQAMALESLGDGRIRLRYAIADLGSFVQPGGPLDKEARRRGITVYCPDRRVPLHPPALSEGAGSLLPGEERPAVVFEIDVDGDGGELRWDVRRAMVRSRERFDYRGVQAAFDTDDPPEPLALLRPFGEARIRRGIERGAITLRLPEQEAARSGDRWTLLNRPQMEAERWNAEVSLLTGMVAAEMMVGEGTGILRTLPRPTSDAIGRLRGEAKSLGIAWNADEAPAGILAGLDPTRPRQLALFEAATRLLRGAGYLGFSDGEPSGDIEHAGVAARYAHVTAPLRRLVDRFTLAACVAIAADEPIPSWVGEATDEVAETMQYTDQRAGQVEGRCLSALEAWVMGERVGDSFEAVVLNVEADRAEIWIDEPPIMTWAEGVRAKPGQVVEVTVRDVDVIRGKIRFTQDD
ncbi:MAG TPA: RNB domain-containing ribonuclease [Acidimicrobiia bacterium]|nr:RNB domain-containing ribonuclease [Acidimicrobiia bacterium]